MKFFSFLSFIFMLPYVFGQITITSILDQNNVSTKLTDGGIFFSDILTQSPAYEVPKGGGVSTVFSMSNWFAGTDVNNQLYLAAQTYDPQMDLFPGPLTTDGSAVAATSAQWPQTIFAVSKSEIDNHIQNYNSPGYSVPQSILDWPAHGDVGQGFDFYLAPFVDVDGDGVYDPIQGDYPCIKGDRAVYIICNDKAMPHQTGSTPIGLELHYMFYQFETDNCINNTTFMELRMINRGSVTLNDFKFATFADSDIGNPYDDYMGSDSSRNFIYAYNADNFDDYGSATGSYGANPPAFGIVSLSHPVSSALNLDNFSTFLLSEYWNTMNGLMPSGTPYIDPNTGHIVNYMFNGNPDSGTGSTEILASTIQGDRKLLLNINIDQLIPNQQEVFDIAFVYNQGSDNLSSVGGLFDVVDSVQTFFDSISTNCFVPSTASINEVTNTSTFSIYPNPTSGSFAIHFEKNISKGFVTVRDISGRIVYSQNLDGENEVSITIDEPQGLYLVTVQFDKEFISKRILIK